MSPNRISGFNPTTHRIPALAKGSRQMGFKLIELHRDKLWFWLKRILPDGSQVNPIANIIFLVLVKEDRQMGSQVDRATNIILILEEK
jgi:hypothetical protein